MLSSDLAAVATALETAAGASIPANTTEAGWWLRIATASEALAGASTSANPTQFGYMLRTAAALESIAGTSGAEENATYQGYLKRIVDALEVQAGAIGPGSLENRLRVAAVAAQFSSYASYAFAADFDDSEYWSGGTQYGASEGPNLWTNPIEGGNWVDNGDGSWSVTNGTGLLSLDAIVPQGSVATVTFTLVTNNTLIVYANSNVPLFLGSGTYSYTNVRGPTDVGYLQFNANNAGTTATLSNVSVKVQPGPWALPGYTYSRTGEQGAVDSTGTVNYFAANVPAINDRGYHAYGALTNLLTWSQEFDSADWQKSVSAAVTANTGTAPDGTATADTLTIIANADSYLQRTVSASAGTYTFSVWARVTSGTGKTYLSLLGDNWPNSSTTECALTTTWQRFVVTRSATSAPYVVIGNVNSGAPGGAKTDASASIQIWQGQLIEGNFPDGGPIIRTAGAIGQIGESSNIPMAVPTLNDADFLLLAKGVIGPGTFGCLFTALGAGGLTVDEVFVGANGGNGQYYAYVYAAGNLFAAAGPAVQNGVLVTMVLKRESGAFRAGVVIDGVLTWFAAAAAHAMPAGISTVSAGRAGSMPQGPIGTTALKYGTFTTDAEVLTAVAEIA